MSVMAISLTVLACKNSEKLSTDPNNPVVGIVDNNRILFDELYEQFHRTSLQADQLESLSQELAELTEFLPLYIDYKAKLADARRAGYFGDEEILAELRHYEEQTAFPYWLENKVRDALLDELIERSKIEINASHILVNIAENATPADTLIAWNKIFEAYNKAISGADFDSLSNEYSSRQMGRSMGGALGYFSGGWAVKDFEDIAYNTETGHISKPFRTQFGYHVVKVHDRRPAANDRLLSHVFLRVPDDNSIDAVLDEARRGYNEYISGQIDWPNLVNNYSQDAQSGPLEGRIGWVNYGRYDPRFTDVVMKMESPGEVTEPFYSGYGVHIVRLDSIRSYASETQFRNEMMSRLQSLPRYRDNRSITVQNIRKAGNEHIFTENFKRFEEAILSGETMNLNDISSGLSNAEIYQINNKNYSVGDYVRWLGNNMDTTRLHTYHFNLRDQFIREKAEENAVDITKNVFPEFSKLSREYLNGLVIFKISEDSVWNYAKTDSSAVEALFNQDPTRYRFDDRYFYHRISAANDSLVRTAVDLFKSGVPVDSLRQKVQGVLVRSDIINDVTMEPYNILFSMESGTASDVFQYRNRPTVFVLDRLEPARQMTFEEAFFRVVADYQPIRENVWLERIRRDYNVKSFPELLSESLLESRRTRP